MLKIKILCDILIDIMESVFTHIAFVKASIKSVFLVFDKSGKKSNFEIR